jgi:hypothetical protein
MARVRILLHFEIVKHAFLILVELSSFQMRLYITSQCRGSCVPVSDHMHVLTRRAYAGIARHTRRVWGRFGDKNGDIWGLFGV